MMNKAPEGFEQFIELAKQSDCVSDFMDKARGIQVGSEVSEYFYNTYGLSGGLSLSQTCLSFMDTVK